MKAMTMTIGSSQNKLSLSQLFGKFSIITSHDEYTYMYMYMAQRGGGAISQQVWY